IKSFVSNLATGQPVLTTESLFEFTDRIMNPHFPKKAKAAPVLPPEPHLSDSDEPTVQEVSRARAIFNASQDLKPFNPADFDFAMDEEPSIDLTSLAPG